MARYSGLYSRQKDAAGKWVYIISAVVIIIFVVAFVYNRISKSRGEDSTVSPEVQSKVVESEKVSPPVVSIKPEPEPQPEPNLPEIKHEPVVEPNSRVGELITKAMECINSKPARIIEARTMLNEMLPLPMSRQQLQFIKARLSELADKWLFSKVVYPEDRLCERYEVKDGDQLRAISGQFKVPYEILMEINGIPRAEALQSGQTIKVINGPFHARVYRSTYTMDLFLQNTFVRSFPVGLGKPGRETPTGLWVVKPGGKLIKPTWTDPDTGKTYEAEDPDYPLGSRWVALEGIKGDAVGKSGIAFHGTKDPNLIGTSGSRGCIRLQNGDAILMYNLLMPGSSQVEIVE